MSPYGAIALVDGGMLGSVIFPFGEGWHET